MPIFVILIPSVPGVQRRDINVALTSLEKHYSMLGPGESNMQRRR